MQFGGEQRLFFNNFRQPPFPTGYFHFAQDITEQIPFNFDITQGNSFADLLLGFGDYGGISVYPAVANKSKETSFYFQDDWKITPRLAVNLGLRYEWSTPYSERFNRVQFSDFNADSGIHVDGLPLVPGTLKGLTNFAGSSARHVPVDRNNWAPRLGFAYQLTSNTVVRGGAGVAATLVVGALVSLPEPLPFVATTRTRAVLPTSSLRTWYVVAVAPLTSWQALPFAPQISH